MAADSRTGEPAQRVRTRVDRMHSLRAGDVPDPAISTYVVRYERCSSTQDMQQPAERPDDEAFRGSPQGPTPIPTLDDAERRANLRTWNLLWRLERQRRRREASQRELGLGLGEI